MATMGILMLVRLVVVGRVGKGPACEKRNDGVSNGAWTILPFGTTNTLMPPWDDKNT